MPKPTSTAGGKKRKGKFKLAYTNRKATKLLSESGSNELSKEDLSYLTEEERLLLSSWDLPSVVLAKYRAKGITTLFKWQLDCLANENVLKGKNLVYSAPTSAGKTLVAEILMIKRVLELGRKAIMILPFVAVAREKMYSLQELYGDVGVRVEGFMGSYNPPGGFKAVDIAICTIEKANSLINRLLEEGGLSQLGTIVVDELHLLGDPHRGYLLELLLTKIRFMSTCKLGDREATSTSISQIGDTTPRFSGGCNIQVIGMSATLPNLSLIATWLNAELLVTDFRPVPLVERIKIGDKIYDPLLNLVRDVHLDTLPISVPNDPDDVVYLTLETISQGHSLLIFCPSKKMCEQTAEQIAREFYNIGNPSSTVAPQIGEMLRSQLNGDRISEILAQLSQCPGGMDEILGKCIAFAVAFHHAGLTYDERDIVESGFKRNVIRVIVATSTLSAGVNLPARRVIIRTPNFNSGLLDVLTYKQMSGRAGRQGIDTEGESILICNGATQKVGLQLVQSSLPPVTSALVGFEQRGFLTSCMKRAIIEVISSGVAITPSEVQQYSRCTLLSNTIVKAEAEENEELSCSQNEMESILEECLQFLLDNDFVRLNKFEDSKRQDEYSPTQLGCACLASSLSPDESIIVFKELEKARRCFVLENELHVIYQVTPIYLADQWRNIDWNQFLNVWQDLSPHEKKVAELVGVEESFILRAMVGIVSRRNPKQSSQLAIHQRFFTALALNDLVNEMPISEVAKKYGVNKGVVQNLQQSASTFAGMVTVFCSRLGWSNLELLLSQFQERLEFGVQRELCDLVRLSLLNGQRARILYDAGIKTVADLAAADPAMVEQHLHKSGPFSSSAHGQSSKSVWMLGKKDGLSERDAAQQIVDEARTFLQIELGLPENVQFYKGSPEKPRTLELSLLNKSKLNLTHRSVLELRAAETSARSRSFRGHEGEDHHTEAQHVDDVPRISPGERPVSVNGPAPAKANSLAEFLHDNVFDDSFSMMNGNTWMFKTSFEREDPLEERPEVLVHPEHNSAFNSESLMQASPQDNDDIKPLEENAQSSFQAEEWPSSDAMIIDDKLESFLNSPEKKRVHPVAPNSNPAQQNEVLTDSLVNMMETSFHMSWNGENEVSSANPKLDHSTTDKPANSPGRQNQLFSEDMFAAEEAKTFKNRTLSSSSNEILNDSSELNEGSLKTASASRGSPYPVLHSTPRSSLCQRMNHRETPSPTNAAGDVGVGVDMEEEETDAFDQNPFKIMKVCMRPRETLEYELGDGNTLKLIVVDDPSFLPEDLFAIGHSLAINFRLSRTKRSSSTPRAIGNKVIGRRFSLSTQRPSSKDTNSKAEDDSLNICLFNGLQNVIWCLQWNHHENDRFPSRRKLNLSTTAQAKVAVLFDKIRASEVPVVMFDAKGKLKNLFKYCGQHISFKKIPSQIFDPRIANWLVQADEDKYLNLDDMIDIFLSEPDQSLLKSRWRKEATDTYFTWKIMSCLKDKLTHLQLWHHFEGVEMTSICPIALMEMNGLGVDHAELERLKKRLEFQAAVLELKSYQVAGRHFSLSSPKDIRQILFREIGLTKPEGMTGTGKDVLKKLDHELPRLIIEWRKVTCALQIVIPFLYCRNLETGRIHGNYSHFTLTGRIMMSDPSLQCIPRDFCLSRVSMAEVDKLRRDCELQFSLKFSTLLNALRNNLDSTDAENELDQTEIKISVRRAFVPSSSNFVLLSADYCQLELRILAHLCQDRKLAQVLNRNSADVFRAIAAQLKNTSEEQVSDEMRQEAKGVTYGIIYGMGSKTLSEQLEIEEIEAARYISQFMRTYPRIKSFIDDSVAFCRKNGFVETLSGRRRYLEHINSANMTERAQAERQAVNSRVQGSASDLVKLAMNRIQSRLQEIFPESLNPVQWKNFTGTSTIGGTPRLNAPCFPVLNLHDELMFEVNNYFLPQIAREIKVQMESCLNLKIKIPVVVRTGSSWGSLTPYDV